MIFRIFWFQKNVLVMVEILVEKFFSYLKVEYVISVMLASPQIMETKTQLYIIEFYEWYFVNNGLTMKCL